MHVDDLPFCNTKRMVSVDNEMRLFYNNYRRKVTNKNHVYGNAKQNTEYGGKIGT